MDKKVERRRTHSAYLESAMGQEPRLSVYRETVVVLPDGENLSRGRDPSPFTLTASMAKSVVFKYKSKDYTGEDLLKMIQLAFDAADPMTKGGTDKLIDPVLAEPAAVRK